MAAQLPVPNAATMQTAVNGMATHGNNIVQDIQAYHTHQQQLATEMSLCANYNVTTIQQQVNQTQQQVGQTQQQLNTLTQTVAQTQQQIAALTQTVAQTQQQVNTLAQTVTQQGAMMNAQFWNLHAKIQNSKVFQTTGTLAPLRSIDPSANPQVPINQHIPNFPGTPSNVSQMNGAQCRDILASLDASIPQGAQVRTRDLRTAVREAIGLAPL